MSNFIYNSYCVEHPGVVHVYQAADDRKSAVKRFSGKRGASALLLAALVPGSCCGLPPSWAWPCSPPPPAAPP